MQIFIVFSTQFPYTILETSTLCSTKVLSQEDSKFVDPILQGTKNIIFFTSKAIILQHDLWTELGLEDCIRGCRYCANEYCKHNF
jgi:hypothetical protein